MAGRDTVQFVENLRRVFGVGDRPTVLERAFMLAKSGEADSVTQLRKQLHKEGHGETEVGQIAPGVTRQLVGIIRKSRHSRNS